MSLRKEIDRYLILIQTLESSFQIAKELEMLPLTFFSTTRDHLDLLKDELSRIENLQSELILQKEKKQDEIIPDEMPGNKLNEQEIIVLEEEEILTEVEAHCSEKQVIVGFLADEIEKKIYADIRTSLTLNDRFRFQRDLFQGDIEQMNQTLDHLNQLNLMDEALSYLSDFHWNWEDESVQAFKEILEKRFN